MYPNNHRRSWKGVLGTISANIFLSSSLFIHGDVGLHIWVRCEDGDR